MRAGERGILVDEVTGCVVLGLACCIFLNTKFKKYVSRSSAWINVMGQLKQIQGIWGGDPLCCGQRRWFSGRAVADQTPGLCLPVFLLYKSRSSRVS